MTKTVHVVLGSKGGIGKTWVAMWIATALREAGESIDVFDLDEQTESLRTFKDLGARAFNVTSDGEIDSRKIDVAIEAALESEAAHVVIDIGSAVYGPLLDKYQVEGLLAILHEEGMQHRAHVVIAGGANNERLGIQSLADVAGVMASPHHPISVWLNPHTDLLAFTPAEFMGFPEVEAIDQAQKIEGCWILPALARRSFDRDVQLARNAGWTFPVVIGDASKRPAELNGTIRLARLRNITAHYLDLFTGALLGRVES